MKSQNLIDMNINDTVKVRLTPEGYDLYNTYHFRRYQKDAFRLPEYSFKLRDLMQIFGPCLFTGSKAFFIDDEITPCTK